MNIYNIDEQLADLFQVSESSVRYPPKNPLNILWLLEHSQPLPEQKKLVDDYYQKLKSKEPKFNKTSQRTINKYNKLSEIVMDENLLCKRMEYLVQQGASIKKYGNRLVGYKSLTILQTAFRLGLDINHEEDDFYPLKTAIKLKNSSIYKYLYDLPDIDKHKIDLNGNTLVHIAALNKCCHLLPDLVEKNIESLLTLNRQNKSSLDMILKWKGIAKLTSTNQEKIKKILFTVFDLHYKKHKISDSIVHAFRDSSEFKHLYIEYQFEYFNTTLDLKKTGETKKMKI